MAVAVRLLALRSALGLLTLSLFAGCAGHAARTVKAREALDRRDPQRALKLYNEELEVSSGAELPKAVRGDNALLLLDRSLILQQVQDYPHSSRDLETADKQVEMLDFTRSSAHEIGRYLFSDDTGPYKARPFEKLLINTLNLVNYLAQGNLEGAKVEARRLSIMQKYLASAEKDDPTAALLGPGSYLAGFAFEQAGDFAEAIRYYDEALKAAPYGTLEEPICRLAPYTSAPSPRIREIVERHAAERKEGSKEGGQESGDERAQEDEGELLIIVAYGRVPALRAQRVPIGAALSYGSLYLDPAQDVAARRMMGQGLASWVNFPELEPTRRPYEAPAIHVDGTGVPLDTVTPIDDLVRGAYERAKGPMIASAITRMITRGAVGAGVGVSAAKASDSSALGMLLALGAQAALSATDTPDTRSWATLPARIAISRLRVVPGSHQVRVAAQGTVREQVVEVKKGGFAVVNLTELSR